MDQNGVESTNVRPLSRKEVDESGNHVTDYVDLTQLSSFSELRKKVQAEINSSSWFERFGADWIIYAIGLAGWYWCHYLLASSSWLVFAGAIFLLGCCHFVMALKGGHSAVHGALCESKAFSKLAGYFFSDFMGSVSTDLSYNVHIKVHHPHTNIVGLGDSSTWKVPSVPSLLYMFVTPLVIPIITPLVSIQQILTQNYSSKLFKLIRYLLIAGAGLYCHISLLTNVSKLTIGSALMVIFLSRNVLAIPYIHVNIFQHIGLPMYSSQHRPVRLYQMYTGVLNLPRNPILDFCFGHGIISCHVEHHLFPELSDNMCLKVKPIVRDFCKEYDLPYNEDSYVSRTKHFIKNYQELMVNAPPITSFVGLQ